MFCIDDGVIFDDNGNSQPNEGTQFEESVDRVFDEDEDTRPPIKRRKINVMKILVQGVIGQTSGIITQLMNWIQQLLIVSIAKLLLVVLAKMEQLLWLIILKDAKNILQIWI